MSDNPFDLDYQEPAAPELKLEQEPEAEPASTGPLLPGPGAYPDIAAEDYHGNPNLLAEPSLSSSGAKTILEQSPYHYWHGSSLNPNRAPYDPPHFRFGWAAHDIILLPETWGDSYHVTPEGFSRTKKNVMADEIAEADAAIEAGKTVLTFEQQKGVLAVAEAIKRNPLAMALLTNGVAEETLIWRDDQSGRLLRARPDFRPHSIIEGREVRAVADLKFVAPSNASPEDFGKAIYNFGYHMSAAFYFDGIKAVHQSEPTDWVHLVIEKPKQGVPWEHAPLTVSIYPLPPEDIALGRMLNRRAIAIWDRCLKAENWPAYADEPLPVGMPDWARMRIEQPSQVERAWGEIEGNDDNGN